MRELDKIVDNTSDEFVELWRPPVERTPGYWLCWPGCLPVPLSSSASSPSQSQEPAHWTGYLNTKFSVTLTNYFKPWSVQKKYAPRAEIKAKISEPKNHSLRVLGEWTGISIPWSSWRSQSLVSQLLPSEAAAALLAADWPSSPVSALKLLLSSRSRLRLSLVSLSWKCLNFSSALHSSPASESE